MGLEHGKAITMWHQPFFMRYDYSSICWIQCCINTLRPRQNGCHFADNTFNRIFMNENVRISFKFSLKFVPKGPINNIPALVQIMAWRRPGDKPLSEPLTHICVTRPQWVNKLPLKLRHGWVIAFHCYLEVIVYPWMAPMWYTELSAHTSG